MPAIHSRVRDRALSGLLAAAFATLIAATGVAGTATAPAPTTAVAPPAPGAPAPAPLNAADVSAWMDGFMPAAISRAGVAGAVVVVVKDGAVLFEKGYGVSDVEAGTPVDPQTTLFRPGSVSKLYTWTAVMQLVEQGKVDLDADVNTYIDYRIPPRDGKPITLRNLMTHTPGFEELGKALITAKGTGRSFGDEMKRWIPTRVFEPGTTPAYSNYGAALAGYVVERVSGMPFEQYVEQHIYAPLGMTMSTFRQPLPAALAPHMSKGYVNASLPPEAYEIVSLPPAGSMAATGDDMAKFMIAHLQGGALGDARILKPETAKQMHDFRLEIMKPLNAMALGFYHQDINGHRVLAHGGDTQWFHSDLLLFIDDGVGLYISMNSQGVPGAGIRQMLFEGFADRYFPAPAAAAAKLDPATAAEHARLVAGSYRGSRGSVSNFYAFPGVIGQVKVVANPDGTISMPLLPGPSGAPRKYRETEPFVWSEVGGHDRVGAIVKDGRVERVSIDLVAPVMVFERAPASIAAGWLVPAAGASAVIVLLTLLAWPAGALIRRRYRAPFPLEGTRRAAFRWSRIGCTLLVLALAGWAWVFLTASSGNGSEKLAAHDGLLLLIQALTLVALLAGTAAAAYNAYAAWTKQPSGWFAKTWSLLLLVAFLICLWVAWAGRLMAFTTNY